MEEKAIPEIVSINQLCNLMGVSRSRYYQILSEGLIHPPVYSDSNRPYFTRELALMNIAVKRNNTGVNGKICIFYNCAPSTSSAKNKTVKKEVKKKTTDNHSDLVEGLSCLGINGISNSQIEAALKKCFPNGTDSFEEGEILRQVYCLIKEQNSADNVNG
jgi:hypothetical protein